MEQNIQNECNQLKRTDTGCKAINALKIVRLQVRENALHVFISCIFILTCILIVPLKNVQYFTNGNTRPAIFVSNVDFLGQNFSDMPRII